MRRNIVIYILLVYFTISSHKSNLGSPKKRLEYMIQALFVFYTFSYAFQYLFIDAGFENQFKNPVE